MATLDQHERCVEQFLAHLVSVRKCIWLYPANSPMIDPAMSKLASSLKELFDARVEPMVLGIVRDQFIEDRTVIGAAHEPIKRLAADLYRARVKVLRLSPGVTSAELRSFLTLICGKPEEFAANGGLAAQMAELDLHHVFIEEAAELQMVDREKKPDQWDILDYLRNRRYSRNTVAEPKTPEPDEGAGSESMVNVRELADFFQRLAEGSPEAAQYLRNTLSDPARLAETLNLLAGADPSEGERRAQSLETLSQAFYQIAEVLASLPTPVRLTFAKNMAKALVQMRPPLRKRLVDEVLPGQLGRFSAADLIIAHLENETIASILTNHVMYHTGTWRTIENFLSGISQDQPRGSVIRERLAANLAHSDDQRLREIATLLGERESSPAPQDGAGKAVSAKARDQVKDSFDEWARKLKLGFAEMEDVCRELTEDCTIYALPYAGELALSPQYREEFGLFAKSTFQLLMKSLEANFDFGRFDVIVRVLENVRAQERRGLKFGDAKLTDFMTGDRLDKLMETLRFLDPVSSEYKPAIQMLRLLGERAITYLFDRLTGEPNRASRMFLLRVFVTLGNDVVEFLGRRIGHADWWVVRNIAFILGKIGSAAASEALVSALHHPEPRVRLEAVQALGAIGGDNVGDLALELLTDEDSAVANAAAGLLRRLDAQRALASLRALLAQQRALLLERPSIAGSILRVFAEAGGEEDLKILAQFRPRLRRLFSGSSRAIAKDCALAIAQIKERVGTCAA